MPAWMHELATFAKESSQKNNKPPMDTHHNTLTLHITLDKQAIGLPGYRIIYNRPVIISLLLMLNLLTPEFFYFLAHPVCKM
jgi:hypothetical protein